MTEEWTRRGAMLGAVGAAATSAPALAAAAAPIARTAHGRVRGATAGGIHVFKGIRYGADTAPRRFQAPVAPRRWSGVVDALAYGPACPQRGDEANQSEDCLFLNVWTPALRDNGRRPVMVYIHGGAYNTGSGSHPLYDGTRLVRRGDVVVVTINHRLNAFGYLSLARLGDFPDSGNAGQLDIVLALQWVRENIEEFGGDPARVLVFGQSGGGAKIATMMAQPAAAGLFHRAATMSGQQVTASGPLNAEKRALAFMEALGLARADVEQLRTLPAARLVEALSARDPVLDFGSVYFGPVLDFVHLHRHPFYPDAAPQSLSIPMMLGNTRDETRGFVGQDRRPFSFTWNDVAPALATQMRIDTDPHHVVAAYRARFPDWTPTEVYFSASTAARSWRGQVIEAEERAKAGAPAYVYQLDWRSDAEGGIFRAPHTLDIPLVFGNLEASSFIEARTPQAEAVSARMMDAFIAFAKTGDPNHAGIPRWTPHTLPTRETMVFDNETRMENDPRKWEREFFAAIPYVQPGT